MHLRATASDEIHDGKKTDKLGNKYDGRAIIWSFLYHLLVQSSKAKCALIPSNAVYSLEQAERMGSAGLKTGASAGGDCYCGCI